MSAHQRSHPVAAHARGKDLSLAANDFTHYVAALGRGPGRSRALTREEARAAFGMVLRGEPDPHQVGAFLMLLRYRGEDPEEITGLVEAARLHGGLGGGGADLDWPSYGAGRTRGAPWFLLAALALSRTGVRVLMHGSNEFSHGISVAEGLRALGRAPAGSLAEARALLGRDGFAYLPLSAFLSDMDRLLHLRTLFGLRSPVNTAARLLNPLDAPAGVDGVFHPPYIDLHLGVAERMGRRRLLVLKGGGGEAERVPAKPGTAHLWDATQGRAEIALPADPACAAGEPQADTPALLRAVWEGEAHPPRALATVRATIALALHALGRADDPAEVWPAEVWAARR